MENNDFSRDFKGIWINKEIWLDKRLNALDKVIFAEIDSLTLDDKGCYASNKYLSEFCQCSESKVTKTISKLIELGYIYVSSFNGRQRELRGRVVNFTRQSSKFYEADCQNLRENNIVNNIDNNIDNNIIYIVDYLNKKAHKNFKTNNEKTKSLLKNILQKQKFTVDDCISVIDKKCLCWLNTEFEKYLRPITLFGNKFESYLNEPVSNSNKNNSDFDNAIRQLENFIDSDNNFESSVEDTDDFKKIFGGE